eukprot:757919-Hanusia_phi.AAC.6
MPNRHCAISHGTPHAVTEAGDELDGVIMATRTNGCCRASVSATTASQRVQLTLFHQFPDTETEQRYRTYFMESGLLHADFVFFKVLVFIGSFYNFALALFRWGKGATNRWTDFFVYMRLVLILLGWGIIIRWKYLPLSCRRFISQFLRTLMVFRAFMHFFENYYANFTVEVNIIFTTLYCLGSIVFSTTWVGHLCYTIPVCMSRHSMLLLKYRGKIPMEELPNFVLLFGLMVGFSFAAHFLHGRRRRKFSMIWAKRE